MSNQGSSGRSSWAVPITVALISAIAGILVAIINNPGILDKILPNNSQSAAIIPSSQEPQEVAENPQESQEVAENPQESQEEAPTPTPPTETGCVVTISNELVPLMSDPDTFSEEIIRVPPGEYSTLDFNETSFAGTQEGWFQIEAEGRTGWIKNDTWTIANKTDACP